MVGGTEASRRGTVRLAVPALNCGRTGTARINEKLAVAFRFLFLRLLLAEAMTRDAALAARRPSLFPGPFVSGALFMGHPTALAGDLTLLLSIHRGKPAILYCHRTLLPPCGVPLRARPGSKRWFSLRESESATGMPRWQLVSHSNKDSY